jgi:hypothetical protein
MLPFPRSRYCGAIAGAGAIGRISIAPPLRMAGLFAASALAASSEGASIRY